MDLEVRKALREVELAGKLDDLLLELVGKAENQEVLTRVRELASKKLDTHTPGFLTEEMQKLFAAYQALSNIAPSESERMVRASSCSCNVCRGDVRSPLPNCLRARQYGR